MIKNHLTACFRKLTRHMPWLFFLLAIFLALEYFALGPFSYVRLGDHLDSIVPRAVRIWDLIQPKAISYWYPFAGGGIDRLSNEIIGFHLYRLPFAFLPGWLATAINFISGLFIAGWFTFAICRRTLHLNLLPSVFAGIAYSSILISQDMIPMVVNFSMLPLIIYLFECRAQKFAQWCSNLLFAGILGLIVGTATSPIFSLPFIDLAVLLWFILLSNNRSVRIFCWLGVFYITSFAVHIPEITSLFTNIGFSLRSGNFYQGIGLEHILRYYIKTASINWIPLVTLIAGCFLPIRRQPWFRRMMIIITITFFLAPLYQPVAQSIKHIFGFLSDLELSRISLVIPFFASIGGAYVIHHLHGNFSIIDESDFHPSTTYRVRIEHIIPAVLIFLIFGSNMTLKIGRAEQWLKQGNYTAHTRSPDVEAIIEKAQKEIPVRFATISDTKRGIIPTLPNFYGFETIDGHVHVTNKRMLDYWRLASIDPENKGNMRILWDKSPDQIQRFTTNPSEFLRMPLLSLANTGYLLSIQTIESESLVLQQTPSTNNRRKWDTLPFTEKIRYRLDENFHGRNFFVYKNTEVMPRWFANNRVRLFDTRSDLIETLSSATIEDLREAVYLERSDLPENFFQTTEIENQARIETIRYTSDTIQLHISTDEPTMLVLTNAYHHKWTATIDGNQQTIYPAYLAFMTILVPSGEHDVQFHYQPDYFSSLRQKLATD